MGTKSNATAECGADSNQVFSSNTAEFAELNLVRPQTVRARYMNTGSYHGVKPRKLASGKLGIRPPDDTFILRNEHGTVMAFLTEWPKATTNRQERGNDQMW